MSDVDPTADTAHECLGVPPDASHKDVKLAAAHAKSQFNPDSYPDGEKQAARDRFHVVKAAEEALLSDAEFSPPRVSPSDNEGEGESTAEPSSPSLSVGRDRLSLGETVTAFVTVDGEAATDGSVETDGGVTARLRNGRATLQPTATGTVTLTASVEGTTDETTVTVESGLTVEVETDEPVSVGDGVTVTATDGLGNPVDGRVIVNGDETPLRDGETRVTFNRPGERTVAVVGGDSRAETTVTVQESAPVGLILRRETVAVGEPVVVEARRRSDGKLAPGTRVETDDGRSRVADDGRIRFQAQEPGETTVRVADADDDAATVSIVPATVTLALAAPATVEPGESFETRVTADGGPAAGARVAVRRDGETVTAAETDVNGDATLTVARPGEYELRATDDGRTADVTPATATLTVDAPPERLAVDVVAAPTATRDRVSVVVRDERGRRVSDATVAVGSRETTTDDRGTASLEIADEGSVELTVTHPAGAETTLTAGGDR